MYTKHAYLVDTSFSKKMADETSSRLHNNILQHTHEMRQNTHIKEM